MATSSEFETVFTGTLFEVQQKVVQVGENDKIFERVNRPPGTRIIIPSPDSKKIKLTREWRPQQKKWDFRLPGGKVFDSFKEYLESKERGDDPLEKAKEGAVIETRQEAGEIVDQLNYLEKTLCEGKIEWDLYYFEAITHSGPDGQKPEEDEQIEVVDVEIEKVVEMCLNGEFGESRSAIVLLRYINNKFGRISLIPNP